MIDEATSREMADVLPLDECLGTVAQQLQTSAGQGDDFAFAVLIVLVIRLDVALSDLGDHMDDLV